MARKRKKSGLPPGTLVYTGSVDSGETRIVTVDYGVESHQVTETIMPIAPNTGNSRWVSVTKINDIGVIKKLGQDYNIDDLYLEDILNTHQRPKIEFSDNVIFVCLQHLYRDKETKALTSEQVSLILTPSGIISFEEQETPLFFNVRSRIDKGERLLRSSREDLLLYSLVDSIVDEYGELLTQIEVDIDELEARIETYSPTGLHKDLYRLRLELQRIRRAAQPLRDSIRHLLDEQHPLLTAKTKFYFRDVYDHLNQAVEMCELYRETLETILDLHFSILSYKTNDVVKRLTIVAAAFMPAALIAGIFGMNVTLPFSNYAYSFLVIIAVMIFGVGSLLGYLRYRKWV